MGCPEDEAGASFEAPDTAEPLREGQAETQAQAEALNEEEPAIQETMETEAGTNGAGESRKAPPERRKALKALFRLLFKITVLAGIAAALLIWVGSVAVSPRGDLRMPSDAVSRLWLAELEEL